jgi:cytochrome c biogenesis protein CcmG, thiol:disulfide interchange protein DsbE
MKMPCLRYRSHSPSTSHSSLATILMTILLLQASALSADNPAKKCQPDKFTESGKINFADYKGKVVYIDYWASWCGPCRASFPFMNSLQKDFADDVVIIGISVDSEKGDADAFLKQTPANFLLGIDTTGVCPQEFKVNGMPSTYILDRSGNLVYSHEGFRKNDPEKLRQTLADIVKTK